MYLVKIENMTDESFALLQKQKLEILHLVEQGKASEDINGLIHLIDEIQDTAVDKAGVPETVVFPEIPEPVIVSTVVAPIQDKISVSERGLTIGGDPETLKEVLNEIHTAFDESGNDKGKILNDVLFSLETRLSNSVTHWMPLPESPEGE